MIGFLEVISTMAMLMFNFIKLVLIKPKNIKHVTKNLFDNHIDGVVE